MCERIVCMLVAASVLILTGATHAQGFPFKPVRIVTGPPGGPYDLVPRLIQSRVAEYLGQPLIIENRMSGAAGSLPAREVAIAAPDGHTLLSAADALSVTHHLLRQAPYDGVRAFAPVIRLVSAPPVLAVHFAFPAKNLAEFIAYARTNPGKITQAFTAIGARGQIAAAVLANETGVELTYVPYKPGGPLPLALVRGDVDAAFLQHGAVAQYVRMGKIRLLAVAGRNRLSHAPDVPAVAESLSGFEVISWFGIVAPANTPKHIVARLHKEFTRALAFPEVREKIAGMSLEVDSISPEEFGAFIQAESEKFGKIIRQYKITAD